MPDPQQRFVTPRAQRRTIRRSRRNNAPELPKIPEIADGEISFGPLTLQDSRAAPVVLPISSQEENQLNYQGSPREYYPAPLGLPVTENADDNGEDVLEETESISASPEPQNQPATQDSSDDGEEVMLNCEAREHTADPSRNTCTDIQDVADVRRSGRRRNPSFRARESYELSKKHRK
ncbi:hypothetical protein GN958_ATG19551 [Phytophthora infestans]|uniref:Uncharacterized protein n=1 Tax=Phytophthora infestans TaxID=4787 RepID=A0A8S9TQY9_PHYIN|nr:hypothetical protein GN958_ATG19551 [Phytophthora infestans]